MSRASEQFHERLRAARERLVATNINDPALGYCIAGLGRVEEVLRKPLGVVILGENNSGKTSVADLMIGQGLLPTSVVSNTHVPVLLTYAEKPAIFGVDYDGTRIRIDSANDDLTDLSYRALQISLPIDRLRNYQILDTPPSISPTAFVENADIVIWCTSRPGRGPKANALPGRPCRNAATVMRSWSQPTRTVSIPRMTFAE